MRKLALALSYCVYLVAVVVLVDYFVFWRPFYHRLRDMHGYANLRGPRYVEYSTMRRLGSLRGDRHSSFPNFALEESKDALRVCAFGDSFTYGDEVADRHDYPEFLQEVFREQGMRNVEVLNFGNSWYGFHQTYILWDEVGRKFGCDVVLLGPDGFQPERDTTFNHSELRFPYYMHARYVLDGDGVKRVDVRGATMENRFSDYFAFVPQLPYLRYDRNAPAFLRAVLPAGRTLANPFYYTHETAEAEAYATYTRLLAELAHEPVQILVLHSLPPVVEAANAVGSDNLAALVAYRLERFPYQAVGGHYASFGNRWIAEQYFALLARDGYRPNLLDFENLPRVGRAAQGSNAAAAPISSYARVYLTFAGQRAGLLAVASRIPGERAGKAEDLAGSSAAGLLALVPEGTSIVDAAFVPTSVAPREGDAVVMRAQHAGAPDVTLGTVHLLDAAAPVGVTVISGLTFAAGNLLLPVEAAGSRSGSLSVLMGTTPIVDLTSDGTHLRLQPIAGALRNFRVGEGEYVANDELADTGTVMLRLEGTSRSVDVPLVRWRKTKGVVFRAERQLGARIVVSNGVARLERWDGSS